MLAASVDQRRHRPVIQIIHPAASQRKTSSRKVFHVRRVIELAVEPWLDIVLIRRRHIQQMIPNQRPHVAGYNFLSYIVSRSQLHHVPAHRNRQQHSSRYRPGVHLPYSRPYSCRTSLRTQAVPNPRPQQLRRVISWSGHPQIIPQITEPLVHNSSAIPIAHRSDAAPRQPSGAASSSPSRYALISPGRRLAGHAFALHVIQQAYRARGTNATWTVPSGEPRPSPARSPGTITQLNSRGQRWPPGIPPADAFNAIGAADSSFARFTSAASGVLPAHQTPHAPAR